MSSSPKSTPSTPEPEDIKPTFKNATKRKGSPKAKPTPKSPHVTASWSAEDDKKLITLIYTLKEGIVWGEVAKSLGGDRTGNVSLITVLGSTTGS